MILSILRSIGSVIAGLFVAFIVIVVAEVVTLILHPFPPDANSSDHEVVKAHVARFPTWVLALGAAIWAVAPLAGAWLATLLGTARHWAHGFVVGAILLALAGFNMSMLPYPIWFPIVTVIAFPIATFLGIRLAKPRNPPVPSAPSDL